MGRMTTTDLQPRIAVNLKSILVLSDDPRFARVIELNLRTTATVTSLVIGQTELLLHPETQRWHLIIVALSHSDSEPVVALSQAALLRQAWQAPLLIISDRPFPSEPLRRIYHLLFPFHTDALQQRVQEILG
jgi:hypothetical protein